ncbi:MAG: biopolymer transporter ExbD [Planctomycetota bacterium]
MAKKRRKWAESNEKEPEVNMTPMIDCVFQLLIFFMVGTRFRSEDGVLAANLPRDKGQRPVEHINKKEELEHVRIKLFLGGSGVAMSATVCQVNQQSIPFDTLRADPAGEALKAHLMGLQRTGGNVPVTIDGEFQVPTRDVVCALNAAISAGYKEINFTVPDFLRRGGGLKPR